MNNEDFPSEIQTEGYNWLLWDSVIRTAKYSKHDYGVCEWVAYATRTASGELIRAIILNPHGLACRLHKVYGKDKRILLQNKQASSKKEFSFTAEGVLRSVASHLYREERNKVKP